MRYRNLQPLLNALLTSAALLLAGAAHADSEDFDAQLKAIQHDWAVANYDIDGDAKKQAFAALSERAEVFARKHPQRAEPLIWQGIVLSTYAGAKGGLGALGLAKHSREVLQKALTIDPNALEGSAYTSLGALYSKVPGFPLGFGDDDKARDLLRKALSINPDGIDANFFYGEFLADHEEYAEARRYLERALKAPLRPDRERADRGRREQITVLLAQVKRKAV